MDWTTVARDAAIGTVATAAATFLIAGGPRKIVDARKAKKARERLRDETLDHIAATLKEVQKDQREIGSDVRCLYSTMLAQLDASEVSLRALHGEHLNGNVAKALESVQSEQDKIRKKLVNKVCADIGEGAD